MKAVVSGYVGKKITGIGRNLISLLSHASGENDYVLYVNEDMLEDFECLKEKGVTLVPYGVSKESSFGNLLWTTFVFPFKVLAQKADVALIPNFTLLLLIFRPTAVIMHDLIEFNIPEKFSDLKMFYRTKIADPITARRADRIMTVSENSKRDIVRFLRVDKGKIDVVYDGVDRSLFKHMDSVAASIVVAKRGVSLPFVLYAGTVDYPGKNIQSVIKAYEKLRDGTSYEGLLILAGMPGKGYDVIEAQIEASTYKDDIKLLGYVGDEELIALYSLCDVFCFVSLYEGFGMPPLEAMSCGAPVVVSDASSLPEVIGNVGYKIDSEDVGGLTDIMKSVAFGEATPFDAEMIKEHLAKFDWSKLAASFEVCLEATVAS